MIYQTSDISEVYYGNINIVSGYVGNDLIFPSESPTPTGGGYLNFTAVDGGARISLSIHGEINPNVSYSFDGTNWTVWDYSAISVPEKSTVYFKGNNQNGFNTHNSYATFSMTGTVEANGSVQSLLYGDDYENQLTIPNEYCFFCLFSTCYSLETAPELPATALTRGCYASMFFYCPNLTTVPVLPATTLEDWCYGQMFDSCTSLRVTPTLPATTLADWCYNRMFQSCTSLTTTPELPALNLADSCYWHMFSGCTSLTTAPELPATTLAVGCYTAMFEDCTSLTTAPELPATTLLRWCYNNMFKNCSNLNYIKAMFITLPTDQSYTQNWVSGVAQNGTFVKNINATWDVRGDDGVPNNWTIQYE